MNLSGEIELEGVPLLRGMGPIESKVTVAPQSLGNSIDQFNSRNYTADLVINSSYQFVNGYDNFTLSSSLTSFTVKTLHGSAANTTDYLVGHTNIILFVIGWRLAGAVLNVITENMDENDRFEREKKHREKVISRILAREAELATVQPNLPATQHTWTHFNSIKFSAALNHYPDLGSELSDVDQHRLYASLRVATCGTAKGEENRSKHEQLAIFKKFRSYVDNKDSKDNLTKAVTTALKSSVKSAPIVDKDTRFVVRVLKTFADFILANCTGLSIVTIIAGFIGVIPGINVLLPSLFVASVLPGVNLLLPIVYIAAIAVGLVFACTRVAHDRYKEPKHEKIAKKLTEEKVRVKQHRAVQTLFDHANQIKSMNENKLSLVVGDVESPVIQAKDSAAVHHDIKDEMVLSTGNSFRYRIMAMLPLSIAVGAVTGWWAVITVTGIVTALSGVTVLAGAAVIIAPAVCAVVVAAYYSTRTIVDLYYDEKQEQEKIEQVKANLSFQHGQAQSSAVLKEVCALSRAELLARYIEDYLNNPAQQSADDSKKMLRKIGKVIGAKLADARDENAYFGYLAYKLLESEQADKQGFIHASLNKTRLLLGYDAVYYNQSEAKNNALALVLRLKKSLITKSGADDHGEIKYSEVLVKKVKTKREIFSIVVVGIFDVTIPIAMGIAVAVAFIPGAAFTVVGIGMVALFSMTFTLGRNLSHRRDVRLQNYESELAKIDLRDDITGYNLSKRNPLGLGSNKPVEGQQPQQAQILEPVLLRDEMNGSPTGSVTAAVGHQPTFFGASPTTSPKLETRKEPDDKLPFLSDVSQAFINQIGAVVHKSGVNAKAEYFAHESTAVL